MKPHDLDLMQHADGEREDVGLDDPIAQRKVAAVGELGELVRGHLELSADTVPDAKFAAMWREIDGAIGDAPVAKGWLARWFDRYRGHVLTGVVSAGAVAALAIMLRPSGDTAGSAASRALLVAPAAYRPTEIEDLETPGGNSAVFNVKDDDDGGSTTVIWVTPEDTVEGI